MRKRKPIETYRLFVGNVEIWDWRNMSLKYRIRIAWRLIRYGIIELNWGRSNISNIDIINKK